MVATISLSPQDGAYTRALKSEKSLSPPIPVGGEAVDTNDWCIIFPQHSPCFYEAGRDIGENHIAIINIRK